MFGGDRPHFPLAAASAVCDMLRLRSCVLTHLLSSPASPLHRLLSAAAPAAVSPSPRFAVEGYLVDTCGLTRAQAVKASAKPAHLKSPVRPDAVLAGLALSGSDVAALVASDPKILCADVDRTLTPVVAGLTVLGPSSPSCTTAFSSWAPSTTSSGCSGATTTFSTSIWTG